MSDLNLKKKKQKAFIRRRAISSIRKLKSENNDQSSNYQRLVQNSNSKSTSSSQGAGVPMLRYVHDKETNLLEWIKQLTPVLEKTYGYLAKFIETDEYYEPPEPIRTVLNNQNDPTGMLRETQKAANAEYGKLLERLNQDKPKMWGDIETYMSKESRDAVQSDASYKTLKNENNVLGFWRLIKQIHRTQIGNISKSDATADAYKNYYSIKQESDEALVDYKNRLVGAAERVETASGTKIPDAEVARNFTRRLDPVRYSDLIKRCQNDESEYKATLSAAHQQAAGEQYLLKGKLVPADTVHTTNVAGAAKQITGLSNKEYKLIMTMREESKNTTGSDSKKRKADDVNIAAVTDKSTKPSKSSSDNNNKDNKSSKKCKLCGRTNHNTDDCYYLSTCQEVVKSRWNSGGNISGQQSYPYPSYGNCAHQNNSSQQQVRPILQANYNNQFSGWNQSRHREFNDAWHPPNTNRS